MTCTCTAALQLAIELRNWGRAAMPRSCSQAPYRTWQEGGAGLATPSAPTRPTTEHRWLAKQTFCLFVADAWGAYLAFLLRRCQVQGAEGVSVLLAALLAEGEDDTWMQLPLL